MNIPTLRTKRASLFAVALLCTLLPTTQPAAAGTSDGQSGARRPSNAVSGQNLTVAAHHAALPMRFEPNVGQTDAPVDFLARGTGNTLFLTPTESVLVLGKRATATAQGGPSRLETIERAQEPETAIVRSRLEGANAQPVVEGLDPLPGITNYFIGNDPSQWYTDIVSFSRVRYSEVYPGIDVVYYGNENNLEYDFIVAPGSDPAAIRFTIDGADRLSIDDTGDLLLLSLIHI